MEATILITVYKIASHLSLYSASPSLPIQFNIHFNIIFPSMPSSSKWSLSLRIPNQNPIYTSPHPKVVLRVILPKKYLVRSTNHKTLPSRNFFQPSIISSLYGSNYFKGPQCLTPPTHILPLM